MAVPSPGAAGSVSTRSPSGAVQTLDRLRLPIGAVGLLVIAVACGLYFLANNAPRDWALHWLTPRTVAAGQNVGDYAVATTGSGWNVLSASPEGRMLYRRFAASGQPSGSPVALAGSPVSITLGHGSAFDLAAWRQDTNGGSSLRAAILTGSGKPRYLTLASGPWPLEHPWAFSAGTGVDVVFSWQHRGNYNLFLSRVRADGAVSPPVQLTHARYYAYLPRAVSAADETIHVVYMDMCCSGDSFNLTHALYSPAGRALGASQSVNRINSAGGQNSGGTPETWGLSLALQGNTVWAAWAGDSGLVVAAWNGHHAVVQPTVAVPQTFSQGLALAANGTRRNLIWEQQGDVGGYLGTTQVGPDGAPLAAPDRVAFESAFDSNPQAVDVGTTPAVMWQAELPKSSSTELRMSRFTPRQLGAPSVWARLGVGLSSPLANLIILLVAGLILGVLLAVANFILLFVLAVWYLLISRLVHNSWKWLLYTVALAVSLYVVFVPMGAPSPPLLFMNALHGSSALVSLVGAVLFMALLSWSFLRRMDSLFRAGLMAFGAVYFLSFLQAMILVQGQVAKI